MEDVRKHGFFREELIRAINEHPTMVTATRRVLAYLALATHNGYGGSPEMLGACFPSNKKIIEALGYSRQTITKAIKDANENYGLGVRQYRKHGRKGLNIIMTGKSSLMALKMLLTATSQMVMKRYG